MCTGWKLESWLGQQACDLTRPLPFHMDFLGMTRASVQFLFPAAHSRQAQGDKTCLNAGNNMGWAEEGHRKPGRDLKVELAWGLGVTQGLVT